MKMRPTPLILLALLALGGPPRQARAAEAPDYKTPDRDWYKGPVKWIMTEGEIKTYKKLATDEERALFVRDFWLARDPTPGTPGNEYEFLFWSRVEDANKSFKSITSAGCLTDRGRTLILLGPPNAQETDSRGYQTFTYEPDEVTGIKEALELRFAPGQMTPLLLDRKELEKYTESHPETRGIGWSIPHVAQASPGPELAAPAAPAHEDQSPESQRQIPILAGLMNQGSGPREVPFSVGYDYYAAADGSTLVALTVETPRNAAHGSGDAALLPYARLVSVDRPDERPVHLTGEQPFVAAAASDTPASSYVYQARHHFTPGAYKVAVIVEDRVVRGQMGSRAETIQIPDFGGSNLQTSSVSLLGGFSRVEAALGPDEAQHGPGPFILGSFRLVPLPSGVLSKDGVLAFYFQVYHPGLDPASGQPGLQATYSFSLREGAAWAPFRKPISKAQGQVELYAIDLKDLLIPGMTLPAEFRLEIKVADAIGGGSLTRELKFSVR